MFDYKKVYKEEYQIKEVPVIAKIPIMNYLAIKGIGDPNDVNGEYQASIKLLYPIAYTLKMSYKSEHEIPGFHQYVVPPLEAFWWIEGLKGMDYNRKADLSFISLIRLPNFVSITDFNWAIKTATTKKQMDFSKVEFLTYDEGLCVQAKHIGSYDDEPRTVLKMHQFIEGEKYKLDFSNRYHHEIYIGDPRKSPIEKLKTIIRHPIKMR